MGTLSGGMLRRVGIAQAIVNDPRVLLLDEPTVGLDPQQRVELRQLFRELGASMTIVLSTHLLEDVGSTAQDVVILAVGSVRHHGRVEELATGTSSGPDRTSLEAAYLSYVSTP